MCVPGNSIQVIILTFAFLCVALLPISSLCRPRRLLVVLVFQLAFHFSSSSEVSFTDSASSHSLCNSSMPICTTCFVDKQQSNFVRNLCYTCYTSYPYIY